MTDLFIDYQKTITTGEEVIAKGEDFQKILNEIITINDELKTFWEEQAATKYSDAVKEQAEYMQQLSRTINEIGEFLIKVGNAYKQTAENNAAAVQN